MLQYGYIGAHYSQSTEYPQRGPITLGYTIHPGCTVADSVVRSNMVNGINSLELLTFAAIPV